MVRKTNSHLKNSEVRNQVSALAARRIRRLMQSNASNYVAVSKRHVAYKKRQRNEMRQSDLAYAEIIERENYGIDKAITFLKTRDGRRNQPH